MTPGQIYAEARTRLSELVRSMPDDQLTTTVPATPAWTVKDVIAHLVGGPTDLFNGVMPKGGIDDWTAAHVEARKDRTIGELLDDWAALSPRIEEAIDAEGSGLIVMTPDLITHEQDVRNATGNPGARDSAGIDWTLQFFTGRVANRVKEKGLPALRIRSGKDEWLLGDGEPGVSVDVDEYDLVRGLVGRRSESQIRSWRWDGDPAPYLPELSVFPFPITDLRE